MSSLYRYLYCAHCCRTYVGHYDAQLRQYELECPITHTLERIILRDDVEKLRPAERDMLARIVPDAETHDAQHALASIASYFSVQGGNAAVTVPTLPVVTGKP